MFKAIRDKLPDAIAKVAAEKLLLLMLLIAGVILFPAQSWLDSHIFERLSRKTLGVSVEVASALTIAFGVYILVLRKRNTQRIRLAMRQLTEEQKKVISCLSDHANTKQEYVHKIDNLATELGLSPVALRAIVIELESIGLIGSRSDFHNEVPTHCWLSRQSYLAAQEARKRLAD